MSRGDYTIALISDTHVGSRYSVFPDNCYSLEGNYLSGSRSFGQLKFLEYWNDFVEYALKKKKVKAVYLLGDLIHGNNPRSFGSQLLTPNIDEQKLAAIDLLHPFKSKRRKIAVVCGSDYHEAKDTKAHQDIALALGGTYFGFIANLQVRGKIINITHGSTSATVYRLTPPDKNDLYALASEAVNKLPHIDVFVEGHNHWYGAIDYPHRLMIKLPCWIAFNPYRGSLRFYPRYQPDIGGVFLTIKKDGRLSYEPRLYPSVRIADKEKEFE